MSQEQDKFWFARSMVAVEPINLHKISRGEIRSGRQYFKQRQRFFWLKDGLYRVTTRRNNQKEVLICAGFMVREGKIVRCAPVLRRHIHKHVHKAEWICEV
jgi:hypothetical protein